MKAGLEVIDSINSLYFAVSEIVTGTDFEDKFEDIFAVELNDVNEEYIKCQADKTKSDEELRK